MAVAGKTAFLVLLLCLSGSPLSAQDDSGLALDIAVAALRHVVPEELDDDELETKTEAIAQAWDTLLAAEANGARRLRKELAELLATGVKDDFFKLSAAGLLWQLEKLDAAEEIAGLYEEADLNVQYNYVFLPSFEAAMTGDPRALPMLEACLRDEQGSYFLTNHAMSLRWPQTLDFIWGAFGPAGLPRLIEILEKTEDPVVLRSAVHLAASAQCLEALPHLRRLARHEDDPIRHVAIQNLGSFGHPDDFDFLLAGLKSTDPEEAFHYAYALYEYDDQRAVPGLIALLDRENPQLQGEALAALLHLMNPAALAALKDYTETADEGMARDRCLEGVNGTLKRLETDWESYSQKSPQEQETLIYALHQEAWNAKYNLATEDQPLSHAQLLEAAEVWKANHSLYSETHDWVKSRHIYTAASAADIPLLLDVRAALYPRLSDECLSEVHTLDRLLKWLGRSRYRAVPGVCARVKVPL